MSRLRHFTASEVLLLAERPLRRDQALLLLRCGRRFNESVSHRRAGRCRRRYCGGAVVDRSGNRIVRLRNFIGGASLRRFKYFDRLD